MAKKALTIKSALQFSWKLLNFIRKLIINIVFFPVLLLVVIAIVVAFRSEEGPRIERDSALVLDLSGNLVDQAKRIDPFSQLLRQGGRDQQDTELELADVIYAITNATHDERINAIVLDLEGMQAGISKLTAVGEALKEFHDAGKKVIAIGDWYDRNQYFLASYADQIYLNPRGQVVIDGFAAYNFYFKSALEKLRVNTHVFRVGTYKSAVEPYIRDDMSAAAKEATQQLIDDLWDNYSTIVANNRNIDPSALLLNADTYLSKFEATDGNAAQLAVKQGWVDALMTHGEFRQAMLTLVAEDNESHSFRQIGVRDYFNVVKPRHPNLAQDSVAVIVAKGQILNGFQAPGEIGGKSTAELIREARFDNSIKALVLRVDSPGGSAFASEEIRQELLALKAAGKPFVVSMGSMAASGGYWISADADFIFATPTTLTGSIGIFGLVNTFEDSLASIGIHADGVTNSEWASHTPFRSLSPTLQTVIQRNIEHGYKEFIALVAAGRDMKPELVDSIAQGRVWSGKKALELGLIDALGDMPQALAKAAELAGIDHYDVRLVEQPMSAEELFFQSLFTQVSDWLPAGLVQQSPLDTLLGYWRNSVESLLNFDDPASLYLYCEYCQLH